MQCVRGILRVMRKLQERVYSVCTVCGLTCFSRSYIDHSNSSLRNSEEFTMKRIQIARIGASLSVLESLLKGTSTFSTTRL